MKVISLGKTVALIWLNAMKGLMINAQLQNGWKNSSPLTRMLNLVTVSQKGTIRLKIMIDNFSGDCELYRLTLHIRNATCVQQRFSKIIKNRMSQPKSSKRHYNYFPKSTKFLSKRVKLVNLFTNSQKQLTAIKL